MITTSPLSAVPASQPRPATVFRIIDFIDATEGPWALPGIDPDPDHLDAWAAEALRATQQWLLGNVHGLTLGPARAERAELNAPIALGELTDAVLALGEPFRQLVGGLRRTLRQRREIGSLVSQQTHAEHLARGLFSALCNQLVADLIERYGEERAVPANVTVH